MNPDTPAPPPADTPQLWRGLEEYMDTPAFREALANEFPEDAAEWADPVTRRHFLNLMAASLALAGAAGCSPRPASQRKILPYTRQPEELTPGVPLFFATACPLSGFVTGVLVRSHEGRPVKVEGNPDHPASLGGTGVFEQASILDLYDPDRSKEVTHRGNPAGYDDAIAALRKHLDQQKGKKGGGLRILTETVTSPTLADLIAALLRDHPDARWCQYDAVSRDGVREGARRAFGRPLNVTYDFTKADVVLLLDADVTATGPGHARYCHDIASRRKVRTHKEDGGTADQMSRLYAVECMPTSVGSIADHRLALPSGQIESFARALAAAVGLPGAPAAGATSPAAAAWVAPLAKDLQAHKGRCAVVVGDHMPASLHALAHAINSHLGNVGQTVLLSAPVEARPDDKVIDLRTLVAEMADKKVEALLILGGNPAYTAPADVDFAGAIKNVPFTLHLGSHQDETAVLCQWHVNAAHYLECWGDGRAFDGTTSIQQPLIAPLYAGKSALELVAAALGRGGDGRELVRSYWRRRFEADKRSGEFETFWQDAIRTGVVPETASKAEEKPALAGNWAADSSPPTPAPAGDEYEINFRPDPTLYDGRFANNGWLQELPKPVTKISWDNAAYVSPATARKMGIKVDRGLFDRELFRYTAGERGRAEVDILELSYKGRTVRAPVWVLPGHADGAVTVHLGYGRERAGRAVAHTPNEPNPEGKPVRGFNAYALRTADRPAFDTGLRVTKTRDTYYLACLQGMWAMAQRDPISGKMLERKPARRATVAEYKHNPEFARIPPTAAGETPLINENVPGPAGHGRSPGSGTQGRVGNVSHAGHSHGPGDKHDHKNGDHQDEHGHDHRLVPLTMYNPNEALFPGLRKEQERRWAMAIDLGACTGCNACVVACQSENNIPTVGKREVTRGHDMFWIRVDRYYEGDPNDPNTIQTHFQPVPCQQCEKAPCEVVCPVGATVHSTDGLNDMVYNRCVGTRYCSNNCPYKVRRFNFLTFQDWYTASYKLGRNPEVSVRSRGVMEKCTYCVQRIRSAEIVAEREGRAIRDGEVVTACQAACPSGAIAFGDLNDPHAVVSRWKSEPTNYGLLAELNTMPRTSYLASVRNPNPDLPKGA
jgi:MoCo/4Fe-4S cofactor protein with predicted Tat translocation signal